MVKGQSECVFDWRVFPLGDRLIAFTNDLMLNQKEAINAMNFDALLEKARNIGQQVPL